MPKAESSGQQNLCVLWCICLQISLRMKLLLPPKKLPALESLEKFIITVSTKAKAQAYSCFLKATEEKGFTGEIVSNQWAGLLKCLLS